MRNALMCWDSIGISSTRCGSSCSPSFTSSGVDQRTFCMNTNGQESAGKTIQVPASTGWPLAAAFGFTLVFAGLLTHVMISILGAVTLVMGLIGWFQQVLPHEVHDSVPLQKEEVVPARPSPKVRHLEIG